ncbi:DNA recombination protein RmuC [Pseudoteredinibacter isoporae]|uniref:DNA recombination protein RmuC n=1 Tax=Pseudoteredinibacter isoporae TaxID=570281 RepID=UPI00310BEF2B
MKFIPLQILGWPSHLVFFSAAMCLLLLLFWRLWRNRVSQQAEAARQMELQQQFEAQREQDLAKHDALQLQLMQLGKESEQMLLENKTLAEDKHQLQLQSVQQQQKLEILEQQLSVMPEKEQQLVRLQANLSSTETKLQEQKEHHQSQMAFVEQSRQQMMAQFEALSAKIYEQQAKRFNDDSQQSLNQLLTPLKSQLSEFKAKVEASHEKESAERHMLAGKISELQKQTQQIGNDAINLAKALKGESKTQGNWGELVLERLLEESGLQRGREYETQISLQTAEGDRRYPDVLIRLPQDKDIVIDSKVSLLDYEAYCSSDDEQEKAVYLKKHVQSIRSHVSGLSLKEYEKLKGIRSLDFVFLFVPVEAAFMAALQADNRLFQDAYNKHIVLVSPTTLMASLRTVENLWRHEKQHKNAQKIADQAGALHDQFVLMLQSLEDLGKQLDKTQTAYELTRKRLASGRGNLIKRSQDIQKLGAKTKKSLPDSYLEDLDSPETDSVASLTAIEGSLSDAETP